VDPGEYTKGGDLINVHYKTIWNCHNESPTVQQIYPKKIDQIKGGTRAHDSGDLKTGNLYSCPLH
jgi:hypothetical protein